MKMNLFEVLGALDAGSLRVYDSTKGDAEQRKDLEKNVTWMIPQWLTGAHSEHMHAALVLEFEAECNMGWGKLYGHPELQTKLLSRVGQGRTKHKFYPPKRKPTRGLNKLFDILLREYPDIKPTEVPLWCRDSTDEDVTVLMDRHGVQMEDRDPILVEITKWRDQCPTSQ